MNRLRESLRRVLITILIIYGLFCVCVFFFQRNLIYFPTKIPANVIESVAREHGFEPWKNSAGEIAGWRIPASGASIGSVLIVHGNAGCALGRDYIAQPIHSATNVDVYVLEYPGYGARSGSPSKTSMVAAAEEAFKLLPPGLPKYLVSESIGAGVACELAASHTNEISGMVLFVPYDNLATVAQRHMPFLPAYFLLLDRFSPSRCLKNFRGPVQFVVAGADEILGPETGRRLFSNYNGRKNLELIPAAHHNDVSSQSPEWWRETFEFWQKKN